MIRKQIILPFQPSPETLRAFCDYLPYCAEQIGDFEISTSALIDFSCQKESDVPGIERIAASLLRVLSGDDEPGPFEKQTVFDNSGVAVLNTDDIFPRLISDGHLIEGGPGLYGMGKLFLRVFKYFERGCYRLALEQNPDEYVYPTLIPLDYLGSGGSLRVLPHRATFVSHLRADFKNTGESPAVPTDAVLRHLEAPAYVCKSAICLHCYPQFENTTISKDRPVTITSQGRCFRFESADHTNAARWWEFIMRESVYLGDKKFVRDSLADMREKVENWMARLRLRCRIETADDLFFARDRADQRVFRLIPEAKLELRMTLPFEKNELAAASFNFHGPYFAHRYNITDGSNYIATGCAGFGIERLAYAFLCQYGLETERWPADIKSAVLA